MKLYPTLRSDNVRAEIVNQKIDAGLNLLAGAALLGAAIGSDAMNPDTQAAAGVETLMGLGAAYLGGKALYHLSRVRKAQNTFDAFEME